MIKVPDSSPSHANIYDGSGSYPVLIDEFCLPQPSAARVDFLQSQVMHPESGFDRSCFYLVVFAYIVAIHCPFSPPLLCLC
jgi:hypothetical protein